VREVRERGRKEGSTSIFVQDPRVPSYATALEQTDRRRTDKTLF